MKSSCRLATGFILLLAVVYAQSQGVVAGSVSRTSLRSFGVKGVPFSADVVDISDRVLSDGNRIHVERHGKYFRDSEGRTRTEDEFSFPMAGAEKYVHITIMDPVEHLFINLDSKNNTATVSHFGGNPRPANVSTPRPQPAHPMEHSAFSKPENLGSMDIEGFTVTGTRNTHTMEAGVIGNEKPITSVTESWYSQDLKTDLLIKSNNPQSGESTRKLLNIHTGEPDPLLFRIPADYTVRDPQQR
jgi:hypothetical protein